MSDTVSEGEGGSSTEYRVMSTENDSLLIILHCYSAIWVDIHSPRYTSSLSTNIQACLVRSSIQTSETHLPNHRCWREERWKGPDSNTICWWCSWKLWLLRSMNNDDEENGAICLVVLITDNALPLLLLPVLRYGASSLPCDILLIPSCVVVQIFWIESGKWFESLMECLYVCHHCNQID